MYIGIDFGTCFSSTAFIDDDGALAITDGLITGDREGTGMPSLYMELETGTVIYGFDVLRTQKRFNHIVIDKLKRSIRDKVARKPLVNPVEEKIRVLIPPYEKYRTRAEILADLLGHLVSNTCSNLSTKSKNKINYITVTVPCGLNAVRSITSSAYRQTIQSATFDAAKTYLKTIKSGAVAGGRNVKGSCYSLNEDQILILEEPVAAALAYIIERVSEDKTILVVDIGGGTSDLAIVKYWFDEKKHFKILGSVGDLHLGGDDWDEALKNLLIAKLKKNYPEYNYNSHSDTYKMKFKEAVINYKHALSECNLDDMPWDEFVTDNSEMAQCTRREFEEASDKLKKKLSKLIDDLLKRCDSTNIDSVIMVGGSCRMPQIKELLMSRFSNIEEIDPMLFDPSKAIAKGAAYYSKMHDDIEVEFSGGASETYGLRHVRDNGNDYIENYIFKGQEFEPGEDYICYDGVKEGASLVPQYMDQTELLFEVFESDCQENEQQIDYDSKRFSSVGLEVLVNVPEKYVVPTSSPNYKEACGTYRTYEVIKLTRNGILILEIYAEMEDGEEKTSNGKYRTENGITYKLLETNQKKLTG